MQEADTIRRVRFFDALDSRGATPKAEIFRKQKVLPNTAYRWLRERNTLGSPAVRRQRKKIYTS